MNDKKIECTVDGVVAHRIYRGKLVSAMCGAVLMGSSECACSLPYGECEHQKQREPELASSN